MEPGGSLKQCDPPGTANSTARLNEPRASERFSTPGAGVYRAGGCQGAGLLIQQRPFHQLTLTAMIPQPELQLLFLDFVLLQLVPEHPLADAEFFGCPCLDPAGLLQRLHDKSALDRVQGLIQRAVWFPCELFCSPGRLSGHEGEDLRQ